MFKVNFIDIYKCKNEIKIGDKMFLAEHNETKILLKFDNEYSFNSGFTYKQFFQSMFILQECHHPAIAKFLGCTALNFDFDIGPSLVLRYYEQGLLCDIISKSRIPQSTTILSVPAKIIILYGVASAMKYLHSNNIVNLNINTSSIMLDNDLYPYIFGFENSNQTKEAIDENIGPNYVTMIDIKRKFKEDVFSFGLLVYNILINMDQKLDLANVNFSSFKYESDLEKKLMELMELCINPDLNLRPTFEDIVTKIEEIMASSNVCKKEFEKYIKHISQQDNMPIEFRLVGIDDANEAEVCFQKFINERFTRYQEDLLHFIYFKLLGNIQADAYIGLYYYGTCAVKISYEKAYLHFEYSASKGDPFGMFGLSMFYSEGLIVKKDYNETFRLATLSSSMNNSYGHFYLGFCFCEGIGCEKNIEKGIELIKLSVSMNNTYGINFLEEKILNGDDGIPKNENEAIRLILKSIELDSSYASALLGNCYMDGIYVEQNVTEAIKCYKRAASLYFCSAYNKLYNIYKEDNVTEAMEYLMIGAKLNEQCCLCNLAELYEIGDVVEKNEHEAFRLIELSANQNNEWAQFKLHCYYINGIGVARDVEKGFNLCKEFAENGNEHCQNKMGIYYYEGEICENNIDLAKKYFKIVADQDNTITLNLITEIYLDEGKLEKAFKYAKKLAKLDDPRGLIRYAQFYWRGDIVEKNISKVFKLFKRSADLGSPFAQGQVGYFYLVGEGVEKDDEKGYEYFEMAADQDDEDSLQAIVMLYFGDTYNNREKAVAYCKKGAKLNIPLCMFYLGKMYYEGVDLPKDYEKALFYLRKATKVCDQDELKTIMDLLTNLEFS